MPFNKRLGVLHLGETSSKRGGDWRYFCREVTRRTTQPCSHFPFVVYVVVAIIGLGCLGIWVELIKLAWSPELNNYSGVLTALATFFPALIGSSSLQLILTSTDRSDKVFVAFGCFVMFVAFGAVVLITLFHTYLPLLTTWSCVLFAFLAVWLWWFTNGDDPTYKTTAVDAASGGDPSRAPKGAVPEDFRT